jgi:sigma-B regulation protein RsbU (phosphoserine phosphatase)
MIPREVFMAFRAVGLMVFLFAFVGVHLNASPEPSELMAKLVGLSLVATLLALVLAAALILSVQPDQYPGAVSPDDLRAFQHRRAMPLALLMLGLPAVVLALFPLLLRDGLQRPLSALLEGVRRVNNGDLSVEVPVHIEDEIGYLARSFNDMVCSVREAMATRERMAAVERELAIARRIQESLFPTDLPRIGTWEFAAGCRPAREVGGDYYDLFAREDGLVVLALGDVAGKGLGPALVMAGVRSVIRSRLQSGDADLGALLADISEDLFESTPAEIFVTLFIGVLDPETGRLRYANAGHPAPLSFASRDAAPVTLDVCGPIAGAFPDLAYAEGSTGVVRGGVFVLYSDGLTEALNADEDMYEEENAVREVRESYGLSAPVILEGMLDSLERFRGPAEQSDDVTILVVRRAGPA